MVYGLFRALHSHRAFLPLSPADRSTDLAPTSGRQDRTASPSASALFVKSAACVHRIPPHVRDDREPPLMSRRDAGVLKLIWVSCEAEYFCRGGLDDPNHVDPAQKNSVLAYGPGP